MKLFWQFWLWKSRSSLHDSAKFNVSIFLLLNLVVIWTTYPDIIIDLHASLEHQLHTGIRPQRQRFGEMVGDQRGHRGNQRDHHQHLSGRTASARSSR